MNTKEEIKEDIKEEKEVKEEAKTSEDLELPKRDEHAEKKLKNKHDKRDEKLLEEINSLKEEVKTLTDKCARTQAEMMNFKRRKEEETSLRLKYCNEDLLLKLVQVADNFERAIQMDDDNLTDEVSKFLEGFKIMYTHIMEILRSNEVNEIEVLGKPFDPKTSEALLVEHFEGREPSEVVDVLQKGYMYKDKLLRSAMVKINDEKGNN